MIARRCVLLALVMSSALLALSMTPSAATSPTDWPTYHRNSLRTGNAPSTPSFSAFHHVWTRTLDGAVYAQPIVVGTTAIVATEGGSLYGLAVGTGAVRWRAHIADPIARALLPCGDIDPLGITGTPAYNPATGLAYAVAETAGGHHILAAVHVNTGAIAYRTTVDPPRGDTIAHQQRAALVVASNTVFIAYGGLAGDCGNYVGQVVAVPENNVGTRHFFAVPTPREGGIWATGGLIAMGGYGLLFAVGNGASTSAYDGSDSVTRLGWVLNQADLFAPSIWASDNASDLDLGSMTPVWIGGRVVAVGKRGVAYLLDPNHLGGIGGQLASTPVCATFGAAAVAGSTAFLPCIDGVRSLHVTTSSLTVGWHAASNIIGPPVVANGTVYATDWHGGRLYALSAASGRARASVATGTLPHFASPTLTGRFVLVGTLSGVTTFTVA